MKTHNWESGTLDCALLGTVRSGRGHGKSFIDSLKPGDPILEILKSEAFPGTLYFELKKPINFCGVEYEHLDSIKTLILPCKFQGILLVAKWTDRFPQNLQLISSVNLRKTFNLSDGDECTIFFRFENITRNSLKIYYSYWRLHIQNHYFRSIKNRK